MTSMFQERFRNRTITFKLFKNLRKFFLFLHPRLESLNLRLRTVNIYTGTNAERKQSNKRQRNKC